MMRHAFLFLSRQRNLRRWMETSPVAQKLTRRFVAGRELDEVLAVGRKLHGEKILISLDHLGENVASEQEAAASCAAMLEALHHLAREPFPATISIKLTQMGLDLSTELCLRHVMQLAETARAGGTRVEIDMESHEYVDRTLEIVEKAHAETGAVRAVLQAYLYRTEADIRRLNTRKIPIRLCKGAYDEPATVAFPEKEKVDWNYLKLSGLLLAEGVEPAFATHDPRMIDGVLEDARLHERGTGDFEFQMLYGVRRDLQRQLVTDGWRLRLYVPYGDAWYPYFMRRLAERPANVFFLAKNLIKA
jgi:proline dehydrogenase